MKKAWIALVVIVVVVLIFFGMYISSRNQMVRKNETIKSDWAQVDVVLERRADLIPNLVATVKGIAAQEVTVFTAVADARANLMNAQNPKDKIAANQQLDALSPKSSRSPKTIRSCAPMRVFCVCRTNLPAPKTASPLNVSATTTPFRTTTPSSPHFQTACLQAGLVSSATTPTSPRRPPPVPSRRSNFPPPSLEHFSENVAQVFRPEALCFCVKVPG